MRRLAVIAAVSAIVLTLSSTVAAGSGRPPEKDTDCVVHHVDDSGKIVRTEAAPEGRKLGQFRCVGGQWVFEWNPFGPDDAITADEIRIDPAGTASVSEFRGPALSNELTIGEIATIARVVTGSREAVIERAIVAVDDGKTRTPEQIEALLAGKDTTGVKVLDTVDKPDLRLATKDLIDDAGGTPETTVVYLSIWGAIKGFFAWVVDTITDIGEWIDRHCHREFASTGFGITLVCRW
ncbi:hypothetical protein [Micromonospora sp. NBC_01813]|uniref:hypothetical protein n=1 Tax=Micromonospora sp. NBC_01813 TaxID=2975988 RepID=UPI002DD8D830|nr:hypothetical protein [Micromonospora sp. NBC_01813]WSA06288.1 hypothetical protein OG958_18355 [Micromonospora sp. NBC_01813]